MSPGDPTIRLVEASGESGLDHARRLFRSYAAEFAGSIAETLCLQGFEAEVAGLLRPSLGVPAAGDGRRGPCTRHAFWGNSDRSPTDRLVPFGVSTAMTFGGTSLPCIAQVRWRRYPVGSI